MKLDLAINLKGCLYSFDFHADRDMLMKTIKDNFISIYYSDNDDGK